MYCIYIYTCMYWVYHILSLDKSVTIPGIHHFPLQRVSQSCHSVKPLSTNKRDVFSAKTTKSHDCFMFLWIICHFFAGEINMFDD